jgi:PilZ domain/Gram-negative bacterial TonB protein C-terminal
MKLNEHERARSNVAGLMSPVQQAEMQLLLAGRWPPLKPLPVFKYETGEYRASIDFDKARGEWVCRKTSLPSNKVQELRGGLTEIVMALPHGQTEVFAKCAAAEQQERELEKDASRRLQAILEWKENYEIGALYSGLQDYLSESQQKEIDDSIRLTLTARQLQFSPKNVAYVFDALLKAGGKLATLIEIAQRNKAEQRAGVPAKADAAAPDAEGNVSVETIHPTRDRRLQKRTTPSTLAYVELGGSKSGTVLNISETGMAVAVADPLILDDYLPRIRFQLPSPGPSIEISAQIVWLAESKKSAGIRFVDLTAEARNQISNWIASAKPAPEFEGLAPAPIETLIPATLESFPEEPIGSVFPQQDQTSPSELIADRASQASNVVTPEIPDASPPSFVENIQEKVHHHALVTGFRLQVPTDKVKSSAGRVDDASSHFHVLELSGFQVAAFALVFLFAVLGLTVGLTVGRGPLGKRLRDAQKSILAVDATSPALPNRPGETTSPTSTPPAANTFHTPAVNPPAPETEESRSKSPSAQSLNAPPEDLATRVIPTGPSSTVTSRSITDFDNSSDANKLSDATTPEEKSKESTRHSESFAKVPSTNSNLSPTTELKPSVNPQASPERNGSAGLIARNAPPPESPKPAHSLKAVGPISGAPRNPAPRGVTPATGAASHSSPPSAILVTAPAYGSKPFRVTFPEKPIAASSSVAMTSELSVLVPPERGPAAAHKPARLQAGELVFFVWPRYPRTGDRYGSAETIKVRVTIGQLGQVQDIRFVSGSISLLPATASALRLWRYKPTRLNKRPVRVQQDVTIEFQPPQYLSQVRTQHPSHK